MSDLEKLMKSSNHIWQLDKDGLPDEFAYEPQDEEFYTGHNGYGCVKCGYYFCVHCVDAKWVTFESECK